MPQSPFPKQTVYHSAIRDAGPITVRITSEPTKSKFQKNGEDQYFISFDHLGKKHDYTIENDIIREQLRGLRGHMVELIASGSKDDATLEILDAGGPGTETPPPNRSSAPQRRAEAPVQPQRQQPPTQSAQEAAAACLTRARRNVMKTANAMLMALRGGDLVRQTFQEETGRQISDAHFQAMCASIFIALDKGGVVNDMPAHPLPVKNKPAPTSSPPPKHEPPAAPPPPPPAPEPDEYEEDDIPL